MTSATPKPRAGEHVLKVAGEVQMKALSHDMGLIRRENERLLAERDLLRERERELVEALHDLLDRVDRNGGLGEYKGGVPFATKTARELLAKHGC